MLARQQMRFVKLLFSELLERHNILNRADAKLRNIDAVERILAASASACVSAGFTTLQALTPARIATAFTVALYRFRQGHWVLQQEFESMTRTNGERFALVHGRAAGKDGDCHFVNACSCRESI